MREIKQKKPIRSYTGIKWRTNKSNKKRLVKDFDNKCAYCDDLDLYSGGYIAFHVEHFAPKEKFPYLKYTYDNLSYACPYCNNSKSDTWISDNPDINIIGDNGFIDPCTDEYYLHLKRKENGEIIFITPLGKYMYNNLKLYLKRHSIIYNLERIRKKQKEMNQEIERRKNDGREYKKIEAALDEMNKLFSYYFDLYADESNVR